MEYAFKAKTSKAQWIPFNAPDTTSARLLHQIDVLCSQ